MSITAIFVTHNSAAVVASSLQAVCGQALVSACAVIDNASDDDTLEVVRRGFPHVTMIYNRDNEGFGRACNRVLRGVTTEYALLVNPDAQLGSDTIKRLVEALEQWPDAAVAAPRLEHGSESLRFPALMNDVGGELVWHDTIARVPFVSGAVALWRMQDLQTIGWFDPGFFLFYEDDDLSLRTAKAGYHMLMVADDTVSHVPGQSCALNESLELLKLRSSIWSWLYLNRRHRGKRVAYRLAEQMEKQSLVALHRLKGVPVEQSEAGLWAASQRRREIKARLWSARYFLRNPDYFDANDAL